MAYTLLLYARPARDSVSLHAPSLKTGSFKHPAINIIKYYYQYSLEVQKAKFQATDDTL